MFRIDPIINKVQRKILSNVALHIKEFIFAEHYSGNRLDGSPLPRYEKTTPLIKNYYRPAHWLGTPNLMYSGKLHNSIKAIHLITANRISVLADTDSVMQLHLVGLQYGKVWEYWLYAGMPINNTRFDLLVSKWKLLE